MVCHASSQGDPVKDLVLKFIGEHDASSRKTLAASDVTQDEDGLKKLMVRLYSYLELVSGADRAIYYWTSGTTISANTNIEFFPFIHFH